MPTNGHVQQLECARPRTLQAQRGFDTMRRIMDNVQACMAKGRHNTPDLIALSPATMNDLQCAWMEMAPPNIPMPMHIAGIKYQVGETHGYAYAFLRDYFPHEKQEALQDGHVLYGEDHKAIVGIAET